MSSNIKAEVFRFLTVRAPLKKAPGSPRNIQGLAIVPTAEGATYAALKLAKKNKDREAYLGAVDSFKLTSDFESDVADFMAANEAVLALEAGYRESNVDTTYTNLLGSDHRTYSVAQIQATWASYLSEIVDPEDGMRAAQLAAKIRYLALMNYLENDFDPGQVQAILESPVLLSKNVFPVPKGDFAVAEEETEDTAEVDALLQEWDDYEKAIVEIENFQEGKREDYATTDPTAEVINNMGVITTPGENPGIDVSTFSLTDNNFSTKTNTILGAIWPNSATGKVRVESTIDRLTKRISDQMAVLSEKLSAHAKVVGQGGVILRTNLRKKGSGGGDTPKPPVSYIGVRPIGIGDLRVVEQELLCYEPGEIAHIENILKGEEKERITRRLNRKESTRTYEVIRELEEERDVQTTDRYQMQQQSSEVINQENELTLGVQVSGSYGTMSVDAQTGYTSSSSSQSSNENAVEYAKTVTERARQRILERTREETVEKIIEEFEETNTHSIKNDATDATHNVGIYRWVDKVYKNQLVNYGKRLMFQFMVPEPAAWHLHAMSEDEASQLSIVEPLDPRDGVPMGSQGTLYLKSPDDLTEANYKLWVGFYNVQGIKAYPDPNIVVSKAYHYAFSGSNVPRYSDSFEMTVPEGFHVHSARATAYIPWASAAGSDVAGNLHVILGDKWPLYFQRASGSGNSLQSGTHPMYWQKETFPVSFTVNHENHNHMNLNVRLTCKPNVKTINQWKLDTFNKIMQAYVGEKAIYDSALAQLQVDSSLIQIRGNNPGRNREIERMELKKGCLQLMNAQGSTTGFASVDKTPDLTGDPTIWVNAANAFGRYIQFFEQVFEWKHMTYQLYPYFWGKKSRWEALYTMENADPTFTAFLQAGAARVLVPVRPGYEDLIIHYLETNQIWEGGDVPQYDDPLWEDVYSDMAVQEPLDVGDPWEIKLPTNLVALQCNAGCIDESGLPCYREP